jgi:serine/threonine protein kinase
LSIIEQVHDRGILHRDPKPSNLLLCHGKESKQIILLDFDLSRSYIDSKTGEHKEAERIDGSGKFYGTPRFCSKYNHQGIDLSRRDDLYSIGYS